MPGGRPREHGARVATQVRVPELLHQRLVAAATERDLPINTLVVKAIERMLDTLVPLDDLLKVRERAD